MFARVPGGRGDRQTSRGVRMEIKDKVNVKKFVEGTPKDDDTVAASVRLDGI